jgi:MoxR-like ATPase
MDFPPPSGPPGPEPGSAPVGAGSGSYRLPPRREPLPDRMVPGRAVDVGGLRSEGPRDPATADPALLERALFEVKRVIVGQDHMVERMLVTVLARGHCLLEGVPGIAKTLAAETLATVVGGSFARIQFTPDLVPSDIVGTRIYRPSSESFDTELGPVMANVVLADEVNRAPAKVQSALLEVMAEGHVSIGGRTHPVPAPFLVLATQNPIESEGVYALPEAQRDRFLMKVDVGYPTAGEELAILYRMSVDPPVARQVLDPDQVAALQVAADQVFVHHAVAEYAVRLVLATRDPAAFGLPGLAPLLAFGASPRATLGLVAAARGLALLRGRDYVLPTDVRDVAPDVVAHRLVLSFDALADGVGPPSLVEAILGAVPLPRIAPTQDPGFAGQDGDGYDDAGAGPSAGFGQRRDPA